jgi:hypothetical protein
MAMRELMIVSALALTAAAPLAAEPGVPDKPAASDKPDSPITDKDISARDVVTTPASDLNLKKDEIPVLLTAAEQRPYTLRGLDNCRQLAGAISDLDDVLGDDVDVPQTDGKRLKPGRVAQSVVGSFIPFRGVIREISGANAHERALQAAIMAGVARRSFLKGIGQGKGCRYPARSATLEVYNARMAALNEGRDPPKARPADADPPRTAPRESRNDARTVRFVSQPMVQATN